MKAMKVATPILAILTATAVVRADDPKNTSPTVLIVPSAQGSVKFSAKEQRGVLGFATDKKGFIFSLEGSAPMDEESRVAAFLDQSNHVVGFNINGSIGYDHASAFLDSTRMRETNWNTSTCAKILEIEAERRAQAAAGSAPKADAASPKPTEPAAAADAASPKPAEPAAKADATSPKPTEPAAKPAAQSFRCDAREDIVDWIKKNDGVLPGIDHVEEERGGEWVRRRSVRSIPSFGDAKQFLYLLAGDWSFSYDQKTAYAKEDLTKRASQPFSTWDVQLGVRSTFYIESIVAITVRGGLSIAKGFQAKEFNQCEAVGSTDPGVTMPECEEKALRVDSVDESAKESGYARLALTYVPLRPVSNVYPGGEARMNLERLGQDDARVQFIATGFVSPPLGALTARFGVGVDVSSRLKKSTDPDAIDTTFTPFVFVGASPNQLEKFFQD